MTPPKRSAMESTDFVRKRLPHRRRRRWILWTCAAIVVVVGVPGLMYRQPALALYHNAQLGRQRFELAQQAVGEQQFAEASQYTQEGIDAFSAGERELQRLGGLP